MKLMHRIAFVLVICWVGMLIGQRSACSQTIPIEVGEEVKYWVDDQWVDAMVAARKSGVFKVQYKEYGILKYGTARRGKVLKPYEVGAMGFARTWESKVGTKLVAVLKKVEGGKVVLAKEDLSEITVPINKLCDKDVEFIEDAQRIHTKDIKKGNIPQPTPPLPDFVSLTQGNRPPVVARKNTAVKPLGAMPDYLKTFQQSGVGFKLKRERQTLHRVLPVGGKEQLVLVGAHEEHRRDWRHFQSQLYWVSLKQQKTVGTVAITHQNLVLDYHPEHERLLTWHAKDKQDAAYFCLWQLARGSGAAKPLVRWKCEDDYDSSRDYGKIFAKVINKTMVLVKSSRRQTTQSKRYHAWDTNSKQLVYSIDMQDYHHSLTEPRLSHDRKHWLVPERGGVSVYETQSGALIMQLRAKNRLSVKPSFFAAVVNQSGEKLAAITKDHIYVWDLTAINRQPQIHDFARNFKRVEGFPSRLIEWIDDDHILKYDSRSATLYRLSVGLPVWSYGLQLDNYFSTLTESLVFCVGDICFYTSKLGSGLENDDETKLAATGAVRFPGKKFHNTVGEVKQEEYLILKPGSKVDLELTNVVNEKLVEGWMQNKIKRLGWVYDQTADVKIVLEMKKRESRNPQRPDQFSPEQIWRGNFDPYGDLPPYLATVKVVKGERVVFNHVANTDAPNASTAGNQGETRPHFFESINFPSKLMDSKYQHGFGVSALTTRGLEVYSVIPPISEDPGKTKPTPAAAGQ